MYPKEYRYSKEHEWVKIEGTTATVGITDFAQSELGDIVFVELPEPGTAVSARDEVAVVESVKAASDIYSPVAGEVTAVNNALVDTPELVNSSPYENGWFFKLKVSAAGDLDQLMDADAYTKHCEDE